MPTWEDINTEWNYTIGGQEYTVAASRQLAKVNDQGFLVPSGTGLCHVDFAKHKLKHTSVIKGFNNHFGIIGYDGGNVNDDLGSPPGATCHEYLTLLLPAAQTIHYDNSVFIAFHNNRKTQHSIKHLEMVIAYDDGDDLDRKDVTEYWGGTVKLVKKNNDVLIVVIDFAVIRPKSKSVHNGKAKGWHVGEKSNSLTQTLK